MKIAGTTGQEHAAAPQPSKNEGQQIGKSDKIAPIDSTARNGESVSRRRFQKGSVFLNKTKTMWIGSYAEYILDSHGLEKRNRKQLVLSPVNTEEGKVTKRQAQKLLQPYLDGVNTSISAPVRERKNITLTAFAETWKKDYLSLSKRSTQSGMLCHVKRLGDTLGEKDMREIGAGDIQKIISAMNGEGLNPKTVRNLWGVVSLIWAAALAQKYVDAVLPKPKLPRRLKTKPRFFLLADVAKIIAASTGETKAFYWLAAETGLRSGELAGLRLIDIDGSSLTVNQSVWQGEEQPPKTDNALRTLAVSSQLVTLLWEQIARQKAKGHELLFSASTGSPWDMNVFRKRKMGKLLKSLKIKQAGFHAFRHFNVGLLASLGVPLTVIKDRAGHAFTGSFTIDVYGGKPDFSGNVEAARKAGLAIEQAVRTLEVERFGGLSAIQKNGLSILHTQAAVLTRINTGSA
jgi:integrase